MPASGPGTLNRGGGSRSAALVKGADVHWLGAQEQAARGTARNAGAKGRSRPADAWTILRKAGPVPSGKFISRTAGCGGSTGSIVSISASNSSFDIKTADPRL